MDGPPGGGRGEDDVRAVRHGTLLIDEWLIEGGGGSGHWPTDDGSDRGSFREYEGGVRRGGRRRRGRWVELLEHVRLPEDTAAAANPKSTTGRLDVFTRLLADGTNTFDHVEAGYEGPLCTEIIPHTFPIIVRRETSLSQIRLVRRRAILDGAGLRRLDRDQPLTYRGARAASDVRKGRPVAR